MVDGTRDSVYLYSGILSSEYYFYVLPLVVGAFAGAYSDRKLLIELPELVVKKKVLIALISVAIKMLLACVTKFCGNMRETFNSRNFKRISLSLTLAILSFLINPVAAHAYIGPGAGFAFLTSFLVLFIVFFLALFSMLTWPIRWLLGLFRRKKAMTKSQIDRMVIVGLDGMDPGLTIKFMDQGKLPNFAKLKSAGCFSELQTTYPSMSPVAWSCFATGVDPSRHNIFDFLNRDLRTYVPILSSSYVGKAKRTLKIGKYVIPLSKPSIKLLRKSKTFWKILGENRIFSTIIRVPITFPPEKFQGILLSGMCTPDLQGTQGTFSYYSTDIEEVKLGTTGGIRIPLTLRGNKIESSIYGPENSLKRDEEQLCIPLDVILDRGRGVAEFKVSGQKFRLKRGEYSDWIKLVFKAGLGIKVHGIARFYITEMMPHFKLYMTPINIDPESPALPISHPFYYSVYLAKLMGSFATLGLAEDTWALNEEVIDEDAFLEQAYLNHGEREKMFFDALEKTRKGACVCVFDTTDRIQHMFYRYLVDGHPANRGKDPKKYKHVIEDLYMRMDDLLGRVLERIDDKTILMALSDHGFQAFRRGVNLNSWLVRNGYMTLRNGSDESEEYFGGVDWGRTKAYTFGLGGLYINQKDREAKGIVKPGQETEELKKDLMEKLSGLKDDKDGKVAIKEVFNSIDLYSGPYINNAPDLVVGYNKGYRTSWDAAIGKVNGNVFEDNTKNWSGDHCIDPRLVPGILFCNRKIDVDKPGIVDIAPTILKLFGADIPSYMDGKPLINNEERSTIVQQEYGDKSPALETK